MRPESIIAAALLVAGLGLMTAMVIIERRPRQGLDPPLIPTTPVMFTGALVAIFATAWLLHLLGIDLPSRR